MPLYWLLKLLLNVFMDTQLSLFLALILLLPPLLFLLVICSHGRWSVLQKSFPIAFLVETHVVREKEAFLACVTLLTPSTFRAGDGTLIVVTQSDGTYLLFKGEESCLFHSQIIGLGMSPYVTCLYHPPFLLSPHTMHTCTHAHTQCTHARTHTTHTCTHTLSPSLHNMAEIR